MPIAIGIKPNDATATLCKTANQPGVELPPQLLLNDRTSASAYRIPTAAAALTSHRNWRRSIRKRSTRLSNEPITPIGSMTIEIKATDKTGRSASMPRGFRSSGKGLSSMGPGASRIAKKVIVMLTPRAQANHRHRGEGRCPSGNSSRRKVTGTATIGIHIG